MTKYYKIYLMMDDYVKINIYLKLASKILIMIVRKVKTKTNRDTNIV